MKKNYMFFLALFSLLIISISTSAAEITYENLITDETTVEEDFAVLGMDMSDYYYSEKHANLEKVYVVAMAESYLETKEVQTYFYVYCPLNTEQINYTGISINSLNYTLDGGTEQTYDWMSGPIFSENGIYKYIGFKYDYKSSCEIAITSVNISYNKRIEYMITINGVTAPSYRDEVTYFDSQSNFKAKINHNLASEIFTIELNYNSMLIIDEYNVVEVEVHQDDNFINNWNSFWSNKETTLLVYFYNFNFPEHIEYDSIEYAKFEYNYLTYYQEQYISEGIGTSKTDLTDESHIISEYNNDSKTLRVNKDSMELTFPTFYLGNRFDDPNFALKDNVNSGDIDYFNMDVSVLLDSTYKTKTGIPGSLMGVAANVGWKYDYTILDEVELIELHYSNDGVLYKCQVVNTPVDEDDFGHVDSQPVSDSFWLKFVQWFTSNFPYSILLLIILGVAVVVGIVLSPYIIQLSIWGIKTLIRIAMLPIRLLLSFFRRE